MTTLFEKLGGEAAINAAVDKFYVKVLADEQLKPFFVGADTAKLASHQRQFLTYAFGGAPGYSGQSLKAAHGRLVTDLGLNDAHFDAVVGHLASTLTELGVAPDLIDEVALVAESVRDAVLNRD